MTSTVTYEGALRTEAVHLQSGSTMETDAPTDNHGKGERFSPTDLIGTALASCMLTTIAIRARALEDILKGVRIDTRKVMSATPPRKIAEIHLTYNYPQGFSATPEQRSEMERIAWSCPVKESLHPDIRLEVDFNWPS
jgi:putative redox protein